MEQRRLRLGDIVDDYCPRERRVTNHAVVAMLEEGIKQTRCSTCDAEHPYKGGHAPRRRKKEDPAALYKEVLAGMPEADAAPVLSPPAPPSMVTTPEPVAAPPLAAAAPAKSAVMSAPAHTEPLLEPDPAAPTPHVEDGPVHRTLIRATLPKVEGHKEVRQVPEFTIRQSSGRPAGNYQGADQRGRPRAAGQGQAPSFNRPGNGSRFGGARATNQGQGAAGGRRPSGGFQSAPPQGRNGNTAGGRKRPR